MFNLLLVPMKGKLKKLLDRGGHRIRNIWFASLLLDSLFPHFQITFQLTVVVVESHKTLGGQSSKQVSKHGVVRSPSPYTPACTYFRWARWRVVQPIALWSWDINIQTASGSTFTVTWVWSWCSIVFTMSYFSEFSPSTFILSSEFFSFSCLENTVLNH